MPIHIIILVCTLGTPIDKCSSETAIDVTQGPRAPNELMCGKLGQSVLAGTVLGAREGVEYVKILCVRDK